MELSKTNKQYIYEQMIDGADAVMVTKLIMYYGKVNFRSACLYRYEAVEWLKDEKNKEQILSSKEEQEECDWKQKEKNSKEEKYYDFQIGFDRNEAEEEITAEISERAKEKIRIEADNKVIEKIPF